MPPFDALLARLGVTEPAGATEEQIAAFEAAVGLTLPPEARDYFRTCDGAVVDDRRLNLVSLNQARELTEMLHDSGYPQAFGYVPLTDNDFSDHFCICCVGPLTGYVVLVPYEENLVPSCFPAQVMFRGIEPFLSAVAHRVEAAGTSNGSTWDVEAIVSDFAAPERTPDDVSRGLQLFELARAFGDPASDSREYSERIDAFRFGIRLLSDEQVGAIESVASETSDSGILKAADERLNELASRSPEAALVCTAIGSEVLSNLEYARSVLAGNGFEVGELRRNLRPTKGYVTYSLAFPSRGRGYPFDGHDLLALRRQLPDFDAWLVDAVLIRGGVRKRSFTRNAAPADWWTRFTEFFSRLE
jgi:hypothetical protein